jgi:FdhE protein
VGGAHVLRCSFCAASWQLSTYRCLYCRNDAETFVTAADPEQPRRRVQLCGGCGGYVKVIEIDAPTPFPLLAVEDLATMDLDLVAIEQKYLRPALPEIKHASRKP